MPMFTRSCIDVSSKVICLVVDLCFVLGSDRFCTPQISLGFLASAQKPEQREQMDDKVVVFSVPGEDQRLKARVLVCLLMVLVPTDLLLTNVIFFRKCFLSNSPWPC